MRKIRKKNLDNNKILLIYSKVTLKRLKALFYEEKKFKKICFKRLFVLFFTKNLGGGNPKIFGKEWDWIILNTKH